MCSRRWQKRRNKNNAYGEKRRREICGIGVWAQPQRCIYIDRLFMLIMRPAERNLYKIMPYSSLRTKQPDFWPEVANSAAKRKSWNVSIRSNYIYISISHRHNIANVINISFSREWRWIISLEAWLSCEGRARGEWYIFLYKTNVIFETATKARQHQNRFSAYISITIV